MVMFIEIFTVLVTSYCIQQTIVNLRNVEGKLTN